MPEIFDINNVEIFATGVHNGDKFTDKDLEEMVRSFEEIKPTLKPFLKLGHDEDQELVQTDGMPAIGWIERLRKVGSKLVADFVRVPKKIYELIKIGAYRRISSEIFFNMKIGDKTFPRALRAVALLGADTPAVQNLDDIIALFKKQNEVVAYKTECEVKTYEFENNKKEDVNMTAEEIKKLEEENAALKADNEAKEKVIGEKDATIEEKEKVIEAKTGEVVEAKKEGEEAQAEIAKNKLDATRKGIEVEVDKLIADPKTFAMPVDKDILCKLFEHQATSEPMKFKVGDEEKTTAGMFKELISRERVALNTENKSKIGETGNTEDNTVLHNQALKFAKDNNVDYRSALLEVSK